MKFHELYFDTETRELVTLEDLRKEYPAWLLERVEECGLEYVREHLDEEFSFEVFIDNCTDWSGTLYPVYNVDHIKDHIKGVI